jgi:hypothetical protein
MRAPSSRKKLFITLLFLVVMFLFASPSALWPAASNASLFLPTVVYDSGGGYALSVAVADVNTDEKPDIGVANWGSGTMGNSDGTFQRLDAIPEERL